MSSLIDHCAEIEAEEARKRAEADMLDGERVFRIVLTVAHLNHDRTDNRPENLAALCQRCHLLHDREQHRETRRRNRVQKSSGTRE